MNIWLKQISSSDGKEYFDLLNILSKYEDVYARPIPDFISEEDFPIFKNARVRMANNINLPKGIIPTNTYWVMANDKPIGYATLKHYLPKNYIGGHTGCCILKEFQNKGIGSLVAKELELIAMNELGLTELMYTSKNENIQSKKSIDKIGGELINIQDGYHFYKVDLLKKYDLEGKGK